MGLVLQVRHVVVRYIRIKWISFIIIFCGQVIRLVIISILIDHGRDTAIVYKRVDPNMTLAFIVFAALAGDATHSTQRGSRLQIRQALSHLKDHWLRCGDDLLLFLLL